MSFHFATSAVRSPALSSTSLRLAACGGVAAAALALTACGGGGGDYSGNAPSALDFKVDNAMSVYASTAHQFNLTGVQDGATYVANFTQTPGAPGTFEGKSASTARQTLALRKNGTLVGEITLVNYFATSPYFTSYGSVDQADGAYSVFNQTANFPVTARVGQSGPLGTGTDYFDFRKLQITDTSTVSWSLEADTASTALLCVNTVIPGPAPITGSDCYRIDANGTVSGFVIKVTVDGKVLILS